MPPPKSKATQAEDSRSDVSLNDKRPGGLPSYSKKSKGVMVTTGGSRENGSALKELALISTENGEVITPGQSIGMNWSTVPIDMLDNYRLAYTINTPAAFTTPLNQALLTNPGIGRQSPTMVRRKDKRRVPREQLATSIRKHFNGAAVSEIDVVVELAYKVKHQNKAFHMRSVPAGIRK